MSEVIKLTLAISAALFLFGLVLYIAFHNYNECREQFSILYCITTHFIR